MDHREFNQKLASFIKEAKKLEKIDPDRARLMWLKIAEFALEFSKKPDIERDFRHRLWKQINIIIEKFKDEKPTSKVAEQSDKEDLDVSDFPSVPKGLIDEENVSKKDELAQSNHQISPSENNSEKSFFNRVQNMKEELKKLPDFFKEINPKPYNPDDTIIPRQKPKEIVDDNLDVNIKKGDSILGNNAPNFETDNIDPYKGTKDIDPDSIKDPFTVSDVSDNDDEKKDIGDNFCYACGAKIRIGESICHECGAKQ